MKKYGNAYPATYKALYRSESITCSVTGTTFAALPVPCAAILDVSIASTLVPTTHDCPFLLLLQYIALPQLRAIRAISGHSVPIITCAPSGAAANIRLYGPESIGGVGGWVAKIDAEVARTGLSVDEIGNKVRISVLCSWTD